MLLREEHGRIFNNQSDTYYLPAGRSRLEHKIHCKLLGGLYPGVEVVEAALAQEWGVERAILDVGTGPGHWAIDMAYRFPHCDVVGVDLAPRTSFPVLPPNFRLEFDDANLGFEHYHGCFDVVHSRFVGNGILNYDSYVAELGRCLRPGGVLILIEGDPTIFTKDKAPQSPAPPEGTYPEHQGWLSFIMHELMHGFMLGGGEALTDTPIRVSQALWRANMFVMQSVQPVFLPIGPWPVGQTAHETHWVRMVGEDVRSDALEMLYAIRPMLRHRGYDDSMIAKLVRNTTSEILDLSVLMYARWTYSYAVKSSIERDQTLTTHTHAQA
ncbi:S-adenosyl-L-methionine-dependent methyltransferase [Clavulina sp. PMI_390]|nr:S-adenosyl-L-methionine-dependent methyltransferase [Clavulina sp. PMI_390]